MVFDDEDTIAAIATASGNAGVGIVRISGAKAYQIASKITGKNLSPKEVKFSKFCDLDNSVIDEGVVIYFKAPNSFTGEDVVELQGHGGRIILEQLLRVVLQNGARIAGPGEFSKRAYLNNKMDLLQAEAVCDLINADSIEAARCAVGSLSGEFSKDVNKVREQLIRTRVEVEANIDFSDEDIDFASDNSITNKILEIKVQIKNLLDKARAGAILSNGVKAVIAGKPNVGKSSTLNVLARDDIAIVTSIPGTTRDVLKTKVDIDGVVVEFVDTAGIRKTSDLIEQIGIKRACSEIDSASFVMVVVDALEEDFWQSKNEDAFSDYVKSLLPSYDELLLKNTKFVFVVNKIDLLPKSVSELCQREDVVFVSAKTGEGVNVLKESIKKTIGFNSGHGVFSARKRHVESFENALLSVENSFKMLNEKCGLEIVAEELRLAQNKIGSVVGDFTSDDLLGEVFSTFCIGK